MKIFQLHAHDCIELNNLLKIMDVCGSGGIAKILIADGQVSVDEQIELRKCREIRI